jgi:hypothetical protein
VTQALPILAVLATITYVTVTMTLFPFGDFSGSCAWHAARKLDIFPADSARLIALETWDRVKYPKVRHACLGASICCHFCSLKRKLSEPSKSLQSLPEELEAKLDCALLSCIDGSLLITCCPVVATGMEYAIAKAITAIFILMVPPRV